MAVQITVHKSISFKLHIEKFKTVLPHTGDDRRLFHAAVHSAIKGQRGAKHDEVTYYHVILILTNCVYLLIYAVVNVMQFLL